MPKETAIADFIYNEGALHGPEYVRTHLNQVVDANNAHVLSWADTLDNGDNAVIPTNQQRRFAEPVKVLGSLTVQGRLVVDAPAPQDVEEVEVIFPSYKITIPTFGVTYRTGFNFSAAGSFLRRGYRLQLDSDESGIITQENQNGKTNTKCYWTIYVPSDSLSGSYGGPKDLLLTPTLTGLFLPSGASVSGVWDPFVPVP